MHATPPGTSHGGPPASPERTEEADVAVYFGFVEALLHGATPGIAERFLADAFVAHDGAAVRSRGEFVTHHAARRARFPDAVWTIELLVSVGGLVICHMSETSRSGMWEMALARVESGRIAECWCICDERLRTGQAGPS